MNNAIYGMTGGQMAPPSLPGMKTTTTPYGRNYHNEGPPMKIVELLSSLDGPTYLERTAVWAQKSIRRTRTGLPSSILNVTVVRRVRGSSFLSVRMTTL